MSKPKRAGIDLDSLNVHRNYLLLARDRERGPMSSHVLGNSSSGDRLGQSRAARLLLDSAGGRLPKPPERRLYSGRVPPTDQSRLYPYTRVVQLATEGMGYGECSSDVLWQVGGSSRLSVKTLLFRRTKTGRQRLTVADAFGEPADLPAPRRAAQPRKKGGK